MNLIIPENYDPVLSLRQTQEAIKYIRDTFQKEFGRALMLERISAPLFVQKSSGLNDNLNGVEKPVSFQINCFENDDIEVVHSLAKWKRMALKKYGFGVREGLYTNMNAIRKDEEVDNLHSYYVDQWDWERVIEKEDRNITTLKNHVKKIFKVIKHMEHEVWYKYPHVVNRLPDRVHFITAQELENQYPDLAAKERENKICKEFGCVFVMQIGNVLQSGQKHDGRAPDYDDWKLNGDLLFWYEPLQCALEISSMGIRVDEDSLVEQLKKENCEDRLNLPYHRAIINKELPYTIGGGIGQSRLCMLLLNRAHIGEVQASIWPQEMIDEWDFIIDLYKICKMANMKIQIPLNAFSTYDRKYAERLVDILHGKIKVNADMLYTYEMKIAGKIYPFLICKDRKGEIQFINRIYESRYQGYVKVDAKQYKVPMFCDLPKEIFGRLYKYDYADLRYQVENTDYNFNTIGTLNNAVIALIGAYDISNESELLEIAEMMLNKMQEVDSTIIYAHINEWQIKKRKNILSNDDLNKMNNLLRNNDKDAQVNCAIYALLDDKENAQKYFNNMSEKEKENFIEFPIYKYVK